MSIDIIDNLLLIVLIISNTLELFVLLTFTFTKDDNFTVTQV